MGTKDIKNLLKSYPGFHSYFSMGIQWMLKKKRNKGHVTFSWILMFDMFIILNDHICVFIYIINGKNKTKQKKQERNQGKLTQPTISKKYLPSGSWKTSVFESVEGWRWCWGNTSLHITSWPILCFAAKGSRP